MKEVDKDYAKAKVSSLVFLGKSTKEILNTMVENRELFSRDDYEKLICFWNCYENSQC